MTYHDICGPWYGPWPMAHGPWPMGDHLYDTRIGAWDAVAHALDQRGVTSLRNDGLHQK